MERLILLLSVMIATISSVSAHRVIDLATNTINPVEGVEETIPSRDVSVLEDGTVIVTYEFSKVMILDDENPQSGVALSISGFGQNMKSGEASWPQRLDRILMPANSTAELSIDEDSYSEFDMILKPAMEPQANSDSEVESNAVSIGITNNLAQCEYGGFLPLSSVSEAGIALYRGESSLKILVNPVKYDPTTHKVRISKRLSYRVTFSSDSDKSELMIHKPMMSEEESMYELDPCIANFSLNAPSSVGRSNVIGINPPGPVQLDGYKEQGYLIISTPPYAMAANMLAEWKTLMGFTVKNVIQRQWTSMDIYNIIKSNYSAMNNLKYVILIGSYSVLPPIYNEYKGCRYPTDYHYGCMDDFQNDYEQDVYIGRISARTLGEANLAINKIINYDKNPITDSGFYSRGIHCGEFIGNSNGYETTRFIKTLQEIYEYMTAQNKSVSRLYFAHSKVNPKYWDNTIYSFGERIPADLQRLNYSWNVSIDDVNRAFAKGAFYLLYNSHGSVTNWLMPQGVDHYGVKNVGAIAQSGLPVVFTMGCQNGAYNHKDSLCLAEALLSPPTNKPDGAVGVIAASGNSYMLYSDVLATGLIDAIYPEPGLEPVFPHISNTHNVSNGAAVYSLGEILQHAYLRMEERFGAGKDDDLYIRATKEVFHIFGDPSLQIRTEFKGVIPFTIERPSLQTKPGFTLNLSKAPAGTIVTAYDEITKETKHNVSRQFTYQTDHPDKVMLVIHAHNYATIVTTAAAYAMDPAPVGPVFPTGITGLHKNGDSTATISYYVPADSKEAMLIISDNNGLMAEERKLNLSESEVCFTLKSTSNGLYGVTLVVDGVAVDSRNVTF